MAIPGFQSFLLPVLKIADDGNEHSNSEAIEGMAAQFHLNEQDRRELLPSGKQPRLDNRVNWALTHLRKSGLIDTSSRGKFRITERGKQTLAENLSSINMKYLSKFAEYRNFQKFAQPNGEQELVPVDLVQTQTPDEILDATYQSLRQSLAQELLENVKGCSPRFFENLVVDLLLAMGYGGSRPDAGQAIGQSGDGGIDGIIKEDRLGLDVIYIQAKRWSGSVGRPQIQAFAGSLEGERAKKGIFITTSSFTNDAKNYVRSIEKKIVLIDGEQLAQLMIDYDIGVNTSKTYVLKKADSDYFNG